MRANEESVHVIIEWVEKMLAIKIPQHTISRGT